MNERDIAGPAERALLRALDVVLHGSTVDGKSKASALIASMFGLMGRGETEPGTTAGVFAEMWNRHYGRASIACAAHAEQVLSQSLAAVAELPHLSVDTKLGALFAAACELHAPKNVSQLIEGLLFVWTRRFGQAPTLDALDPGQAQEAREHARQLERLINSWATVSLQARVGMLGSAICALARRAQVPRKTLISIIQQNYDTAEFPEAVS